MLRLNWEDLPDSVRAAIESEMGPIIATTSLSIGRNSEVSATLQFGHGNVFCKGISAAHPKAWMHRNEGHVNPFLPHSVAPRLLWEVETAGWLLLGFEFASGQHADLAPGSPDLPLVAAAVSAIGRELTPCPVTVRRLSDQWRRISAWQRIAADIPDDLDRWERHNLDRFIQWESRAIDFSESDSLIHSDLHPLNILVSDRAKVVDWAWSCRGAAWIDPAFLTVRLIKAGHSPQRAEEWAEQLPTWTAASEAARTAFSVAILGMWEYQGRRDPAPHWARLTDAARKWAKYRVES